jgi:hypothetical protein
MPAPALALAAQPGHESSGFLPYFPLLLFIVVWLVSNFITSGFGWASFARKYRARVRPAGRSYRVLWASFGFFSPSYRHVLRVIFTEEGVYFYVLFLFRPFHAPFLLPWESIRGVEEERNLFRRQEYRLEVADGAGKIEFLVLEKAGQELFWYYLGINRRQRGGRKETQEAQSGHERGEEG